MAISLIRLGRMADFDEVAKIRELGVGRRFGRILYPGGGDTCRRESLQANPMMPRP